MRKSQIPINGDSLLANLRYRKKWKRLTSILSIFVVVGTISALMLPAITMNLYICGQEEHTHQDSCYRVNTEDVLICTAHHHEQACFDPEGSLICTREAAQTHRHTDGCYTQQQSKALICQLPEHTHTDECRPLIGLSKQEWQQVEDVASIIEGLPPVEEIEAQLSRLASDPAALAAYREKIMGAVRTAFDEYGKLSAAQQSVVPNAGLLEQYRYLLYKEETLEIACDGYRLTIHCPAEAQIPADAVVEMTPVDNRSEYLSQATASMPDFRILDGRFFDISIYAQGEKIQPAADVELTITFDQPMAVQVGEQVQLIHFGAEGMEILEGYADRDDTHVYAVTFRQGSFSVSGAVSTQPMVINEADNGPHSMTVEYYVYINGVWEKVGTTTTGWVRSYNGNGDGTCNGNHTRDYLTVAQVASILGEYGFDSNHSNPARTIYYQPLNVDENTMVWSDTATVTYDGQRIIPLSTGTKNYRIYFAPLNKHEGNIPGKETSGYSSARDQIFGANYATENSKFYSIDVQDPQHYAFATEAEGAAYRVVFRSGDDPTITLPKPSTGDWQFYHDGGELNKDLKFTPNGDGTMSCTVHNLTQHLRAIPVGTTDFGPDRLTVTYLVFLDNKWQVVGETKYYWRGTSTNEYGTRDLISANQIHSILHPYGFSTTTDFSRQLAYQQKSQDACYSDTCIIQKNNTIMFPLSVTSSEGYNIYFIPNNTTEIKQMPGSNLPAASNRFWSITVVDGNGYVYKRTDTYDELSEVNTLSAYVSDTREWSHFAAVAKEGTKGSVKVRRAGFAWRWRDGVDSFPYRETQELHWTTDGDYITVTTNDPMTKQLWLDAYDNSLRQDAAESQAGDIETVSGNGISFKLFNYRADINEVFYKRGLLTGPTVRPGLDAENYFAFRDQESPWKYHTLNSKYDRDGFYFYSDGVPDRTMVEPNLVNGMPMLDLTHRGHEKDIVGVDKSLDILFQGDGNGGYVQEFNCVNTPLRYDTSDGYYKYDSAQNAADFSVVTNTWYIRNRVERGQDTAEKYPDYADFLPFNNGNGTPIGTANGNVPYQYKMLDIDYWFGMTMSVNFYQGKDGKIDYNDQNTPMEFHFSGDDDVWVFLDNMLVLDIGGTHGAVDGFINFHTGLVTTEYNFGPAADGDPNWKNAVHASATTIYECYKYALEQQGLTDAQVQEKLNEIFVATGETVTYTTPADATYAAMTKTFDVYRFKDYSSHKMNFFYMERGGGSSNCAISFNLPTLPDETLFVGKELEFDDPTLTPEQIAFAKDNLTYRFRVVDANGNPIFRNCTAQVLDESFKNVIGTTTLDADGWFALKAGQRVKFQHMLQTLQELKLPELEYYVQEAIPATLVGQYNGVVYKDGGTSGAVNIEGQTETDWIIYKTNALSPENTYTVIYTNKVDVEKMSFLQIRKEVLPGSVYTGEETFPVVVTIAGQPVAAGTQFHYTDNGQVVIAGEGGIVLLEIGRTLQLSAPVMAGTAFCVRENVPSGWTLVGYSTTQGTAGADMAAGDIPLDNTVLVTITNRTNAFSVHIPVTKEFRGGPAEVTRTATFTIQQVTDKNGQTPVTGELYPTEIQDLTITCQGSAQTRGDFILEFQPNTHNGTYYYRIQEESFTIGENESFLMDSTVYVVEVTVENSRANVTALYIGGQDQAGNVPGFVNLYATVELPDCGGPGTTLYTFSGLAMVAVACALMYNTKRKQRKGAK